MIDNVAVEHSAKKQKSAQRATAAEHAPAKGPSQQKSAQKASVAEQVPAKAPSQQAASHIEKKAPDSQRRTTPRQKALQKADGLRPGLCDYDSYLIASWILYVFLLQSLHFLATRSGAFIRSHLGDGCFLSLLL